MSFFSTLDTTWKSYSIYRSNYYNCIPIPQDKYLDPIHSIDDFASLIIRPISKPLFLAFNVLGFLVKAIINTILSILLAPCALFLSIFFSNSQLKEKTNASFYLSMSHAITSVGMTCLAFVSTVLALVFNPIFVISRGISTVIDGLSSVGHSLGK